MKKILVLVLFLAVISSYGQDNNKNVVENNVKIGELNERLDRLINGSTQISGDSISIKIDQLIYDIREIKSEIKELKATVNQMSEEGVIVNESKKSPNDTQNLSELENKLKDFDEGVYYVIIASARQKENGQKTFSRLEKRGENIKMTQNSIGTWYHIVLAQEFNITEAIRKVNELRKDQYKDAWFMTGRKLKMSN